MIWPMLSMAGAGIGAFGQYQGGRAQRQASNYNARLMDLRAKATEQAMESDTRRMTDRARRMQATQRAAYAKSGAQITSGTPLLVMAEQAAEMDRDLLEYRRGKMIEAQQLRSGAEMKRWEGSQAQRAGTIGAFGTLLGGAASAGSMFSPKAPQAPTMPSRSNVNFYYG